MARKGRKLADGKPVGGKGRFTDKVIDKTHNHYGNAIRRNPGNIDQMKNDIWAIYHHMIANDISVAKISVTNSQTNYRLEVTEISFGKSETSVRVNRNIV